MPEFTVALVVYGDFDMYVADVGLVVKYKFWYVSNAADVNV